VQLDAVEVHVLPVELPHLGRLVGQSGMALERRLVAPVLDGVAEADVALDALESG